MLRRKSIKEFEMQSAADIINNEYARVQTIRNVLIDVARSMTVVELDYGVVVETNTMDSEGTTLVETLFSHDRELFTIIGRWRFGPEHHEMKSYPRDSSFPIRSRVRL
jgi:hypothetical protein